MLHACTPKESVSDAASHAFHRSARYDATSADQRRQRFADSGLATISTQTGTISHSLSLSFDPRFSFPSHPLLSFHLHTTFSPPPINLAKYLWTAVRSSHAVGPRAEPDRKTHFGAFWAKKNNASDKIVSTDFYLRWVRHCSAELPKRTRRQTASCDDGSNWRWIVSTDGVSSSSNCWTTQNVYYRPMTYVALTDLDLHSLEFTALSSIYPLYCKLLGPLFMQ